MNIKHKPKQKARQEAVMVTTRKLRSWIAENPSNVVVISGGLSNENQINV